MSGLITSVAQDVRIQSLNSMTAGFSFAAALAWLDVIRWLISSLVRVKANGGSYYVMSALLTTLIAVLAVMLISRFGGSGLVKGAQQPVFAVTR